MTAFFERRGPLLVPGPPTVSVWSPDMLDGRSVVGLAAWAVESEHGEPGMQVARLTVDLFRAAPMRPLRVVTRPVRSGRRIRTIEVGVLDGEVEVARATALLLVRGAQPDGKAWAPAPTMPGPDSVGSFAMPGVAPDVRRAGGWGTGAQGVMWIREDRQLVAGEPLTPFLRAALIADLTNPMVNSGEGGLAFINTDVSLYLARDGRGEWVGLSAMGHVSADGIAAGTSELHDVEGLIGFVTVSALVDTRLRERGTPEG